MTRTQTDCLTENNLLRIDAILPIHWRQQGLHQAVVRTEAEHGMSMNSQDWELITVDLQAVKPPQFVLRVGCCWSFSPSLTRLMLRHVGNTWLDTTIELSLRQRRSHPAASLPLTGFGVGRETLRVALRGRRSRHSLHGQLWGLRVLGPVSRLLRAAAVEAEHPTQFVVEQLAKARRQRQHVQDVYTVRHQLPEAGAAKVEQGGRRGARSDHLHAALRSGGARHRIKPLISHLCGGNSWSQETTEVFIIRGDLSL